MNNIDDIEEIEVQIDTSQKSRPRKVNRYDAN